MGGVAAGRTASQPKLAVIGASHFQMPLITKAQEMGCEVHAFAWKCGDPGESAADAFHPISITEVDKIVDACRRIGVDGVCTIASDLATVAVCSVADALGLVGNSLECMRASTNKRLMRAAFARGGDPSPRSVTVGRGAASGSQEAGGSPIGAAGGSAEAGGSPIGAAGGNPEAGGSPIGAAGGNPEADGSGPVPNTRLHPPCATQRTPCSNSRASRETARDCPCEPRADLVVLGGQCSANIGPSTLDDMRYPLIVKPADRSGSRGITKLEAPGSPLSLDEAVRVAIDQSFCGQALVEEFAEGMEYSVEGMSWQGEHHILAITRKFTTGAPHFIETGHLQPAGLAPEVASRVADVTRHALDTLGVSVGASHTELKIAADGTIRIIEIGARMGGDCIGSHLVELSCGVDYVRAVVDVALGRAPDLTPTHAPAAAASRFLFGPHDIAVFERLQAVRPDLLRYSMMTDEAGTSTEVTDSSTRLGHYVIAAPEVDDLLPWLPSDGFEQPLCTGPTKRATR